MPDLFDHVATYPAVPGHSNPTTSKAAAASMKPEMGRLQRQIFDYIAARPSTAREVENALTLRAATVTARIREMVLENRLEDSGDKRETPSGRRAIVWRAK
jgi:predicted transcriptional regulator